MKSTELACELHKILVTDGPFAETREQLGGYFLVEANNTDEAIDIATRLPMARFGTIVSPRFGMVADRFGVSWMIYVAP